MIDSVLKGTGNSRFLKSAVPAGTSWADALAMLQAGTFPIDFNGINTEGFQQVGTPLNKANLLKDATAAQIGLPPSTTPDGMFQALGNTGELHVWRKTVIYNQPVPEVPGSYTLGAARQYTAGRRNTSTSASSYISKLSVSNEISVDLDGNVTLVNPTTVSLRVTRPASFASDSARTALGGYCYFMATDDTTGDACDMYLPRDQILYVAENAVYTYAIKEYDSVSSFDAAQLITGVPGTPAIPAGTTTTYPVSTNPNAYQEGDDAKAAGYVLGDVENTTLVIAYRQNTVCNFSYSDALYVADDGSISLANPTSGTAGGSYNGAPTYLSGKFLKFVSISGNGGTTLNEGVIYYIPSNATIKIGSYAGYVDAEIDRYQPVTGYPAIPAGTTIEYLGKLGDKARVQAVSYVGTGTHGESNPNSLTFDFVPKAVFLFSPETYQKCFVAYGDTSGYPYDNNPNGELVVSWDKKKMSWFQYDSANNQFNLSNYKYRAIAIG